MVTVGYARLSTQEQASGLTLQQQISRLEAAGAERVIVDLQSGRSTSRPGYRELLGLVETRQVSRVVATRWDRLSRSASETCRLVDVFAADGAPELLLLDDPMDLSSIGGRLQLRLLGAVAEAELERIRERSAAGKAHRRARGMSDVAPLGLQVGGDGKLRIDRRPWLCTLADRKVWSRSEVVEGLFDRFEEARQYAAWKWLWDRFGLDYDRTGIARTLLNPAYRGARVGKRSKSGMQTSWASVEEGMGGEALIDADRHRAIVARVRGELARNERSHDTRRSRPLVGKVFCDHCGKRSEKKWLAAYAGKRSVFACTHRDCPWSIPGKRRNSISELRATQAVLDAMSEHAEEIAKVLRGDDAARADTASNTREMEVLVNRRQTLLAMQADGAAGLDQAIAAVDRQMADLAEANLAGLDGDAELTLLRRDLYGGLPELPGDQQLLAHLWGQGEGLGDYLRLLFSLGPEFWLDHKPDPHVFEVSDPEAAKAIAMRWFGRFVRRIVIREKEIVSVELNL